MTAIMILIKQHKRQEYTFNFLLIDFAGFIESGLCLINDFDDSMSGDRGLVTSVLLNSLLVII